MTGASGMLGQALCREFLSHAYEVFAMYKSRAIPEAEWLHPFAFDLASPDPLERPFLSLDFDCVVHCAALTHLETCEDQVELAFNTNFWGTNKVAQFVARHRIPPTLIYISSDAVYSDRPCPKNEDSDLSPSSFYGLTKLWGEELVWRVCEESHLIFRTTIFGGAPGQLLDFIIQHARQNTEIPLFNDVYFTPISVQSAARYIRMGFEMGLRGTYNLGGAETVTKAEFGEKVLERVNPRCPRKQVSVRDYSSRVKRALNMCLDSSKVEKLLGSLPTLDISIDQVMASLPPSEECAGPL